MKLKHLLMEVNSTSSLELTDKDFEILKARLLKEGLAEDIDVEMRKVYKQLVKVGNSVLTNIWSAIIKGANGDDLSGALNTYLTKTDSEKPKTETEEDIKAFIGVNDLKNFEAAACGLRSAGLLKNVQNVLGKVHNISFIKSLFDKAASGDLPKTCPTFQSVGTDFPKTTENTSVGEIIDTLKKIEPKIVELVPKAKTVIPQILDALTAAA